MTLISRVVPTDDDGTGTTGTVLNAAYLTAIYDSIENALLSRCAAYNSGVQSVANATAVPLTFDTEDFDVTGMHSTSVNTSRITIPANAGGIYLILGQTTYAANATGIRQTLLRVNGATTIGQNIVAVNSAGAVSGVHLHQLFTLAAGDYVELVAVQNSGGALNVGSATRDSASQLQVIRLWGV